MHPSPLPDDNLAAPSQLVKVWQNVDVDSASPHLAARSIQPKNQTDAIIRVKLAQVSSWNWRTHFSITSSSVMH